MAKNILNNDELNFANVEVRRQQHFSQEDDYSKSNSIKKKVDISVSILFDAR